MSSTHYIKTVPDQNMPSLLVAINNGRKFRQRRLRAAAFIEPPKPVRVKQIKWVPKEQKTWANFAAKITSGQSTKPQVFIPGKKHPFNEMVDEVCQKHNLPRARIESDCRTMDLVIARREIAYRARTELAMSYPEIGRRIGRRDHTTALNLYKNWERLVRIKTGNGKFDHLKTSWDDRFNWDLIQCV